MGTIITSLIGSIHLIGAFVLKVIMPSIYKSKFSHHLMILLYVVYAHGHMLGESFPRV